jgi:phosphate uptake regulator
MPEVHTNRNFESELRELQAQALAMGEHASHSADVPAGLRVMWVANDLERIADHATNVAEEVIFMVRGQDVRHGLAERE